MVAKRYQNPSGGLNEAGRDYFKRTEGSNLNHQLRKVKPKKRISFAARFSKVKGPLMKDDKGNKIKTCIKKMGFWSKEAARNFANKTKEGIMHLKSKKF